MEVGERRSKKIADTKVKFYYILTGSDSKTMKIGNNVTRIIYIV